ncbi:hypothetical protein ACMC5R_03030 [Deferribacteres bacterium DY0037]
MKYPILLLLLLFSLVVFAETNEKLLTLISYNEKLSTLYPTVGSGMAGGRYNIEFDELINYPEGSCSQQGYLLARRAKQLGFEAKMLGLFAENGANDVMVDVRNSKNAYLFVPSAGAYYKQSLWQIVENVELAKHFITNHIDNEHVTSARQLYLSPIFFENIYRINFHHLNDYETNILKLASNTRSKKIFDYPYNEAYLLDNQNKYYTAGKRKKKDQSISYLFDNVVKVYRFEFVWYSENDFAKNIKIKINNNYTIEIDNHESNIKTEVVLPKVITDVKSLEFIFNDFNGQDRLLLRQMGVY